MLAFQYAAARAVGEPSASALAIAARHIRRVLGRIKLLQLDSVNVAVRAHYMPVFSRLGPYDPDLVDDAAWRRPVDAAVAPRHAAGPGIRFP